MEDSAKCFLSSIDNLPPESASKNELKEEDERKYKRKYILVVRKIILFPTLLIPVPLMVEKWALSFLNN